MQFIATFEVAPVEAGVIEIAVPRIVGPRKHILLEDRDGGVELGDHTGRGGREAAREQAETLWTAIREIGSLPALPGPEPFILRGGIDEDTLSAWQEDALEMLAQGRLEPAVTAAQTACEMAIGKPAGHRATRARAGAR